MRIEFSNVEVTREGRSLLRALDLVLEERRLAVIGANGSGKTTFARLLNALVLPSSGSLRVDGLDTRRAAREVRQRVGMVFQFPEAQIIQPIVVEDVAFGLELRGVASDEARRHALALLEQLGLEALAERPAHSLSGGERQLVALAAVLITEPELIVFDEPTNQLDLANRNALRARLAALEAQVLVVTHDLDFVADFDRALLLEAGRVAFDGPPRDAAARYVTAVSAVG
ncbi:energy-coupling factor ABC transporter ATP-binding protein [Aquibaculum arenosum]|uniref:ABC transporter ATP-binding protein n=1 Tax=Aquibaculum arenosum TaxID=3032591 RepID=A0ABT5YR12_9PROT|nr:ABC transporter ATP-binding protein [Fodinicurvata sp. CAU 1616]MDF2097287.1 ABC transporter ATP-binding protein [Fodinicurvata sp. CAU 1616]